MQCLYIYFKNKENRYENWKSVIRTIYQRLDIKKNNHYEKSVVKDHTLKLNHL